MPEQVNLSPIEAHECAISEVFSDRHAFEIPPYQRPYAWETEQARDLLNDISDAMDNTAVSGGIYFIGSIVLIKSPNDPLAKVIDGQQRLTTLTILLSVLRDLTKDDERRLERRAYIFQKADPDKGTKAKGQLPAGWKALNLTPEQKTKAYEVLARTRRRSWSCKNRST